MNVESLTRIALLALLAGGLATADLEGQETKKWTTWMFQGENDALALFSGTGGRCAGSALALFTGAGGRCAGSAISLFTGFGGRCAAFLFIILVRTGRGHSACLFVCCLAAGSRHTRFRSIPPGIR